MHALSLPHRRAACELVVHVPCRRAKQAQRNAANLQTCLMFVAQARLQPLLAQLLAGHQELGSILPPWKRPLGIACPCKVKVEAL